MSVTVFPKSKPRENDLAKGGGRGIEKESGGLYQNKFTYSSPISASYRIELETLSSVALGRCEKYVDSIWLDGLVVRSSVRSGEIHVAAAVCNYALARTTTDMSRRSEILLRNVPLRISSSA